MVSSPVSENTVPFSLLISRLTTSGPDRIILALDLQPMAPLPDVIQIQADLTHPSTPPILLSHLKNQKADLVVCDGAPDVTGLHDLDEYIQAQLLLSAVQLATRVLLPGGTFIAKIFRGRDSDVLFAQLRTLFARVVCAKPRASRGSSLEAFVVCREFVPPEGFNDAMENPFPTVVKEERYHMERWIAPFIACGDLSAFDSDATYTDVAKPEGGSLDPIQPPTKPPYRRAVLVRRGQDGGEPVNNNNET
jgi:tRNA (cytidine32/guanosine34-2'-O)-methyltransferase